MRPRPRPSRGGNSANVELVKEDARDVRGTRWLEEFVQDVRYGLRSFARAPAFALSLVVTIGLGVGISSSAFTVFNAYVLRPFDVRDPSSLYSVNWMDRSGQYHDFSRAGFQRSATAKRGDLRRFRVSDVRPQVRIVGGDGRRRQRQLFRDARCPPGAGANLSPGGCGAAGRRRQLRGVVDAVRRRLEPDRAAGAASWSAVPSHWDRSAGILRPLQAPARPMDPAGGRGFAGFVGSDSCVERGPAVHRAAFCRCVRRAGQGGHGGRPPIVNGGAARQRTRGAGVLRVSGKSHSKIDKVLRRVRAARAVVRAHSSARVCQCRECAAGARHRTAPRAWNPARARRRARAPGTPTGDGKHRVDAARRDARIRDSRGRSSP